MDPIWILPASMPLVIGAPVSKSCQSTRNFPTVARRFSRKPLARSRVPAVTVLMVLDW